MNHAMATSERVAVAPFFSFEEFRRLRHKYSDASVAELKAFLARDAAGAPTPAIREPEPRTRT